MRDPETLACGAEVLQSQSVEVSAVEGEGVFWAVVDWTSFGEDLLACAEERWQVECLFRNTLAFLFLGEGWEEEDELVDGVAKLGWDFVEETTGLVDRNRWIADDSRLAFGLRKWRWILLLVRW